MRFRVWLRSLLLVSLVALPGEAWAKKISIEWKPIEGASRYELRLQRGKAVISKLSTESAWSGDLPFGFYLYQIRAFDRVRRPGEWTPLSPLVVMPTPPDLKEPADGHKFVRHNPGVVDVLKWFPVPGVSRYRVELFRGSLLIETRVVEGTETGFRALPSGDYKWQVIALVESSANVPPSFAGRKWESKPSEPSEFGVAIETLAAPVQVAPLGTLEPPRDGKQELRWKKVEGATAYEVELTTRYPAGRAPATPPKVVQINTAETFATVRVPGDGYYTWRVRAVASVETAKPVQGPQSTADFRLDKNARYFEGSGYVALSTMVAPYSYTVVSANQDNNGTVSSAAFTLRASAEYWLISQWGVAAGYEGTHFKIGPESFVRKGFELQGKYRVTFGEDRRKAWALLPKLGVEGRDYFQVRQFDPLISSTVYGLAAGLDLRKQLTDKLSLGIKASYFRPFILRSDLASELTSDASNRNFSVGLQAYYWFGARWGAGAGVYHEKRSISYKLRTDPGAATPEQLVTDGTYFFGTLIYSFK